MYNTLKYLVSLLLITGISYSMLGNEKLSNAEAQEYLNNQNIQFVENKGQIKDNNGNIRNDIKYYVKGNGMDIYFRDEGVSYVIYNKESSTDGKILTTMHRLDLNLNRNKEKFRIEAKGKNQSTYSFFNQEEGNYSNIKSFSKIIYEDVYDGVDFVYYPENNNIKYDIIVDAGVDPNIINIEYEGHDSIKKNNKNQIEITTTLGAITEDLPETYQIINNNKSDVATEYTLNNNVIGFQFDDYDETKELVIDPLINWAKLAGGNGQEIIGRFPNLIYNNISTPNAINHAGGGVATNDMDTVYITGSTNSTDFPFTSGINIRYLSDWDMFIQSYDINGTLFHSHYIGGSRDEFSTDIDINQYGRPIIVGNVQGPNVYTTSGLPTYTPGSSHLSYDIYIYEYDLITGIRARHIGGTSSDYGRSIDIDDESPYDIYVVGDTRSTDFEMVNCTDCMLNGTSDAIVVKLDSNLNTVWSTYLGGSKDEIGMGIDHRFDEVAVVGATNSEYGFPLTNQPCYTGSDLKYNALNNTLTTDGNITDGFLARLDDGTNVVVYADYKGGEDNDYLYDVVSFSDDASGYDLCQDDLVGYNNLIMVGHTRSSNPDDDILVLPYKLYREYDNGGTGDNGDGWVIIQTHFNEVVNSYFGGIEEDVLTDIEISDDDQTVIIAGYSNSDDIETTHAEQPFLNQGNASGDYDAIILTMDLDSEPIFSSYNGSSNDDYGVGADFNSLGMMHLYGETYQSTSPTVQLKELANSYSGGVSDVFVTTYKAIDDDESTALPTFYGGDNDDEIKGIATDYYDNIYITGYTESNSTTENFPATTGSYDDTHNGDKDAFVSKFNRLGRHLWTTYIGGSDDDEGCVIKVDNDYMLDNADIFVAGKTNSSGLSVGDSAEYKSLKGNEGGFLARLSNDGTDLKALSYLYTEDKVTPHGIDLSDDDHVYVCGTTNFEKTSWAQHTWLCNSPSNYTMNNWNFKSIYCYEDNLTFEDRLGTTNKSDVGFVSKWDYDLSFEWGNYIASDPSGETEAYDVAVLDDEDWVALVGYTTHSENIFPNQWGDNVYGDSQNSTTTNGDKNGWVMVIKDADTSQYAAWGTLIEGKPYGNPPTTPDDVVNNVEWLEQPGEEYDLIIGGHSTAQDEEFIGFPSINVNDVIDEHANSTYDIFLMRFDINPTDPDWWSSGQVAFYGDNKNDTLIDMYSHELMDSIVIVGTTKSDDSDNYDGYDFTDFSSIDEDNDNFTKTHGLMLITDPVFNYIRGTFLGDERFYPIGTPDIQDFCPTGVVMQDDGEILFSANTESTSLGMQTEAFQQFNEGMTDGVIGRVNHDIQIYSKEAPIAINESFENKSDFIVYPNPTKNELKIRNTNRADINGLEIYDASGKIIMKLNSYTELIDVTSLVSGVYFLRIYTESGSQTISFIKY